MLRSEGLPLALQVIWRPWPCPLDASSNLLDYWSTWKNKCPRRAGSAAARWGAIEACVAPVEGGDRGPVTMFPVAGAAPGTE